MQLFRGQQEICKYRLKYLNYSTVLYYCLFILFLICFTSSGSDESKSVFKLGERFFSDSLYNLALEQYQKYLTLQRDPENDPAAYYKVAFCHYKMGNTRDAAEGFEDYIRLFPSETNVMDVIFLAGETRKELGDFKEASDWFYSVWSRFVGSAKAKVALFEAAECSERDNNFDRAIELYSQFVNKFPQMENAKQASLSLVKLHIDRQEYTRAEEILDKVEKKWKSDKKFPVRVLYYKGLLARNMQKIEIAEKMFQEMVQLDKSGFPERESAYKTFIDVLVIQKKYKETQDVFGKLKKIYTEKSVKPKAFFFKKWADNARKAHLFKAAIPLYQKLLDEYSEDIDVYQIQYRLAECYVGTGDFPKAIENLRNLELQDSAGEYAARSVLKTGELYFNKGLYPSAISAYRRYLQLPDRIDKDRVIYRVGKIYQEKYKRFGAAVREFENLFKLYPASQYYQQAVLSMAQCQEALKEYEAAVRNYEYLSESGGDSKLVEKAENRSTYIRDFLIKDFEAAVFELAAFA
jgi:tetratricopeptide (TPR) repeat protein